jgi:hypothetical protein
MARRWTGAHAFRDHANDRVIEPGEELPEDVADQIAAAHPHQVEQTDDEPTDTDDESEATSPIDPTEHTVPELEDALEEGDYSDAELDAIADAEAAGESRNTALDAIEAARE